MRAVAEKSPSRCTAGVKFDTHRYLQRHRAVLSAIARHLVTVNPLNSDRQIDGHTATACDERQVGGVCH